MNHDINAALAVGHVRAEQGYALSHACSLDDPHEADSAGPHNMRFEPRMVCLGHDEHDLQFGLLLHAPGEVLGEAACGQELVLDVNGAGGTIDRVEEQRFDFADLLCLFVSGRGARNADVDPAEIGHHAGRPRIPDRAHSRGTFACATHPPLASQFRQRTRGVTIDHRLYVVEWTIGDAGRVDPARIVEPMLGRIPAPNCHIKAPAKSDRVVHHYDFLMMRCAGRQIFVQAKANASRRKPTQCDDRE